MSQGVPPVEDFAVRVHPRVSDADLVPLKLLLVLEAVELVVVYVGHAGAGNHLHGAAAQPHLWKA